MPRGCGGGWEKAVGAVYRRRVKDIGESARGGRCRVERRRGGKGRTAERDLRKQGRGPGTPEERCPGGQLDQPCPPEADGKWLADGKRMVSRSYQSQRRDCFLCTEGIGQGAGGGADEPAADIQGCAQTF